MSGKEIDLIRLAIVATAAVIAWVAWLYFQTRAWRDQYGSKDEK